MATTYSRTHIIRIFSIIILLFISVILLLKPTLRLIYPYKYSHIIKSVSAECGTDEFLIAGIISAESRFDSDAVSHKGAKGLMQIRDKTKKWCIEHFNIKQTNDDVAMNVRIGCTYLVYLIEKYGGNTDTAIAAYNAGEGNVTKWLEDQKSVGNQLVHIPFEETKNYLERVKKRVKIYRFLYS